MKYNDNDIEYTAMSAEERAELLSQWNGTPDELIELIERTVVERMPRHYHERLKLLKNLRRVPRSGLGASEWDEIGCPITDAKIAEILEGMANPTPYDELDALTHKHRYELYDYCDRAEPKQAIDAEDKEITDQGSECYDFYKDGEQFSVFIKQDNTVGLVANVAGQSYQFKTRRIMSPEQTQLLRNIDDAAYAHDDAERQARAVLSQVRNYLSRGTDEE